MLNRTRSWGTFNLLMVLAMLLSHPIRLWPQSTFGTLTGTISDPSGAVIADASVVVRNKGTQVVRTVISDASGNYLAVNLDPGIYDLAIEASGFGKLVKENIELLAWQTVRVDARLEVAAAAGQEIEVTVWSIYVCTNL